MEPTDDPKLSKLLREWQVSGAPASLDARVLGARKGWWRFLLTGSIRIPVPVGVAIAAILLMMATALVRQRAAPPPASTLSLVSFRPAQDLNVRVMGGNYEAR